MDPQNIISFIKEKDIKPVPKWQVRLHKIVIWVLGITVIIIGGFVFSKLISSMYFASWEDWDYITNTLRFFTYSTLPLVWVLLFVAFVILSPMIYRKTENGYKYDQTKLIFFSIFASLILSSVFIKIDPYLYSRGFLQREFIQREIYTWSNPYAGRISGKVEIINGDIAFVRDFSGKVWMVDISHLLPKSFEAVEKNKIIKIIGKRENEDNFSACQVSDFDFSRGFIDDKIIDNSKIGIKDMTFSAKEVCKIVLSEEL